ncbi:Ig-like domain-containing protein [Rasiella rasia]|uniref:Ig-like domain-containing protein n=1 Tax=Rasiella rasia TaxID=2744027 RepID=A0A6G6GLY0_9FLAO|nr:Ig-like domain-containing protein [Rasiella rasia]QIE59596.1 Ig-like domain-containing protein [Rasiella rasia]
MKKLITHLYHYRQRVLYLLILCLFSLSFVDCAKRGNPSGGKRDSLAPVIVKSSPENYSTHFEGNEIRITFDEYIKLVEVQKNLIISPPLKYQPIITPLSTSKQLRIKILDTLKENTTYSFNFGNSIVDNNEENEFPYFKYVFSTGSYIDSLTLNGTVKDAVLPKAENPVSVLLYEYNETFSDSIIFKEKPTYITVTKDSTNTFEFTNLKEGKYLLIGLKEKSNDYIFQPKTDKIGFLRDTISLPADTTYSLTVFTETPDCEVTRPAHHSKQEILFGFNGKADSLQIRPISEVPQDYTSKIYKDFEKDTLHYWFKPAFDVEVTDSLLFLATNRTSRDTLEVRLKKLFADSLNITPAQGATLTLLDTFKLQANTPINTFSEDRIEILDKDSIAVPHSVTLDTLYNRASIVFDKTFEQNYKIKLLPGAITDFFEATNDTLSYSARTKAEDEYGDIALTLRNAEKFPLIIELVNEKFKVIRSKVITENSVVSFPYIEPGFYYIRIVFDTNANNIWDSGNFLQKLQPEAVKYYGERIEIRGNWDQQITFTLE